MKELKRVFLGIVLLGAIMSVGFASCTRDKFAGTWSYNNQSIDLEVQVAFAKNEIHITAGSSEGVSVTTGTYRIEGKTMYITLKSVSPDGENYNEIPEEERLEVASRFSFDSEGTLLIDEIGYPLVKKS